MTVVTIILGVLLIIGGFSCMFTPLATFLAAGYLMAIMFFVYAIVSLVKAIQAKTGVLSYIISALGIIVGFIMVFRPDGMLAGDMFILISIAIWFLIQGIFTIIISIKNRKQIPLWGLGIASGVLGILAAVISFVNPAAEIFAIGILIGMYFIEAGISLVTFGSIFAGTKVDK